MEMPARDFNAGDYRYEAQGHEKIDEISSLGNHYSAQFWEIDRG